MSDFGTDLRHDGLERCACGVLTDEAPCPGCAADERVVRAYLADAPWGPVDDEYVAGVLRQMAKLRRHYPNPQTHVPDPIHGPEESGACIACDARRVLMLLRPMADGR